MKDSMQVMKVKRNIGVMIIMLLCSIGVSGCQSAPIRSPEMAEPETFTLTYEGARKEIPLSDCTLVYDSEELQIYVKDIEYEYDNQFPFYGPVVYMQTQTDSKQILGMQDYCVDRQNEAIYIVFRDERDDSFAGVQRYFLKKDSDGVHISEMEIISTYLVEKWLTDTYRLTEAGGEGVSNLRLTMNALEHDEQGNVSLKGEASGVSEADGSKYHVDWEIGGDGEARAVPREVKKYDKEVDKEAFAACENAFDLIEQCDKSVLKYSEYVEFFTKEGQQRYKENGSQLWQRVDVSGDGLPELVVSEVAGRDKIYPITWIFAYTGGMTRTVEMVFVDLNDYTEYMFLGCNGNLVYDYTEFGLLDYGSYSQYRFDDKWERVLIENLKIYYFYGDDYYKNEDMEEDFKESFPDTYGKNGSGYYFFRTRLKNGVEPEHATDADWIEEEITRETFVEAYREMTGFEFFEVNEDFAR